MQLVNLFLVFVVILPECLARVRGECWILLKAFVNSLRTFSHNSISPCRTTYHLRVTLSPLSMPSVGISRFFYLYGYHTAPSNNKHYKRRSNCEKDLEKTPDR